uniref:Zinc finger, SWIM-type containing 8 n=1 Tax=Cyprinus carpio TaxID=7962 RepID=A0A8C2QB85_CYPCA
MELMFAEWEDGERFSFEDSDRFEEDSLCSFISEAESLCQNWRGWRKQSAGPNSPTVKIKAGTEGTRLLRHGQVIPLVELSAKQVAFHIPFEVVEKVYPPVPEQLQLRIAYWSFPENEEDIRLYSCLANGSPDEFQRGEQLYRVRAVKDPLQIGFHLSATVVSPQAGQSKGAYNVAVMFDRCRITSCSCTCGAGAKWCAHVVALCLFRIHNASAVCLRAPVSESLSRLQRDQLQKFAQYLISELPQQILPTAQRLLDELLSSQSTAINTVCGAPDPTSGPSASDQSTWYLDESTLSDNIKKTVHKFCGPSPVVFSKKMVACLLRPLRGREPEGIWNLLSIVREMFKRRDSNAAPLLEILTEQCLTYEQIIGWWYSVRTSASHSSASGHTGRSNGQTEVAAHACASMCDEMVVLWRLAVLDPTMSPQRRLELAAQLKLWHLKVIEIVKRGQHRKSLDKLFQGFKPAVECCYFNWEVAYPLPGITYCGADKKNTSFCWVRTVQQQRGAKAGTSGEPGEGARGGTSEGTSSEQKSRCNSHLPQQEVAVRPKETIVSKRKGVSGVNSGGVLVCLGGRVSISLQEGGKGMHKASSSSQTAGSKAKLTQSNKGSCGSSSGVSGKHPSAKRRTSSEDSSLEPDMAELSLDDGSSLALGAEASNTFDFLPPPPEMLPSPKRAYETKLEADLDENGGDEDPVDDTRPSAALPGKAQQGRREGDGSVVSGVSGPQAAEAAAGADAVCEDDYQAYYLSAASEEGADRGVADSNHEEEPDIFAGIKPLEQEGRMEILFACVEALYAHGYSNEACRLAVDLARDLLANPPDLKVEQPQTKGKKSKVSTSKQTQVATNTLSKVAFLLTVLSERLELHNLAFNTGMFSLELQRPPASTKALEVKLAYQESEVVALLKKIPLGLVEMTSIRDRAEQLRDGNFCDYRPVLPLMLASFIFDVLLVSPTGSRPPSRNRNNEMPGDEELGFEAAVAALGMKTTVSEAEHPLLCEGTRREKGDLALALMITYKDDQSKLKKILDKLLDRESQTHKPQTLSSFYSSKPATSSQKSPSKHAAHGASGATGGVSKHTPASAVTGEEGAQSTSCEQQSEAAPFKPEGTVPSRLALGGRGAYGTRCWGSPVRQKKKHTGMASIDSSAPETTSDSSPTLSRRPFRGGWTAASWGRGQDSDSISSSSSDSLGSSSSSGSRRAGGGARAKSTDTSRYKGRRPESHAPHVPNQPSEAAAHFYFELAKTVLIKAGGNSSTSIFTQPSASGGHQGPHRNLHLCAFEIGLYALGLHNFVSPNWLSRTYSSHVSWITGQAMEIGSAALNILVECWDGHLTPPEVASLADRASRARDPNMVRAAAELALSCLPHAHALNPNEIQRALVQCKEQDNVMLEKACMAVEEAAKGGGVYPEVLFEVAHQWYWLYEQTVGGGSGAQREGSGRCRANGGAGRTPPEGSCGILDNTGAMDPSGVAAVTTTVTAAAVVPVISVGSTIYQSHALPGSAMGHAQGLHPYTTIQTHLPTVCTPQYLGHPLQHIPRPAVFPVSGAAYPQGMHPAFIGAQYPFSVATGPHPPMAATAVTFPGVPMPSMTQIAVHPYHTAEALSTTVAAGVHSGSTIQAIQGASHPGLSSQPASLVSAPFPVEDEQHSQPISQQGLHYLHSAYRVGMLALEMLGRRAHNDHPNNFSRSPPYTEDVKWLLGLAARLGDHYGGSAEVKPCTYPRTPPHSSLPPACAALPADPSDSCGLRRLREHHPKCPRSVLPDTTDLVGDGHFLTLTSSNLMAIYVLSMSPNIFHSLVSVLCDPLSSFRWLIRGFSLTMLMFGSHLNKNTKCQTYSATFLYPGEQSLHRA